MAVQEVQAAQQAAAAQTSDMHEALSAAEAEIGRLNKAGKAVSAEASALQACSLKFLKECQKVQTTLHDMRSLHVLFVVAAFLTCAQAAACCALGNGIRGSCRRNSWG